ncbi:eosinophil peroxidase-like [Branchiostoma floridae x Branchiostoma belcheri]
MQASLLSVLLAVVVMVTGHDPTERQLQEAVAMATIQLSRPPAAATASSSVCSSGWSKYGSRCFRVFTNRVTYAGAQAACRSKAQGGRLAMPKDKPTNDALVRLRNGQSQTVSTWIGLNDIGREGRFVWEDRQALGSFRVWAADEPNNLPNRNADCVKIEKASSSGVYANKWRDYLCNGRLGYICEKGTTQTSGTVGRPARPRGSGRQLAVVHRSTLMTTKLSKCASILEKVAKSLMASPEHYSLDVLSRVNSPHIINICARVSPVVTACPRRANPEFRSADGRCNNQRRPLWGSTEQCLKRLLPPEYDDGFMSPRTIGRNRGRLPTARRVSTVMHEDLRKSSQVNTHMVMQFGQFLDHDFTLTPSFQEEGLDCDCDSMDERCFNINIPSDDRDFAGRRCLGFARSRSCPNEGCRMGRRQQLNQITAFVDASNVYGSSDKEIQELRGRSQRDGTRGQLKSRLNPAKADKKELLPGAFTEGFECDEFTGSETCSQAGDVRVNEQPGLTSMHTVFLREHNRIAKRLSQINPRWSDDRVFFETRKIVGALMQKITYGEFLPRVLGPATMTTYRLRLLRSGFYGGYDSRVNPTISNVFATAAFRFGHSLVQNILLRYASDFNEASACPIRLAFSFFNPSHIFNNDQGGPDSILRGLTAQPHQDFDRFMVSGLTKDLFADPPGSGRGLDLAALNIQRGRDHGLPGYNAWRVKVGLRRARRFADLSREIPDVNTRQKLESVYSDVDDIDLFVGGLAEESMPGGVVGPTFACLLAMQFQDLRKGDRFWFENRGQFTAAQLAEIRKTSLARILCDNTDGTTHMQPDVFRLPTQPGNERVRCSSLSRMDLTKWRV